MKIKLHHVNLCSGNVPAMNEFYRGVLDMEPESSLEANRDLGGGYAGKVAFLSDGATQFHLAEKDLGVGFRTDDIATVKQRLKEKGIPFSDFGAWAMKGWEQVFFYDPDGNIIEVHQVRE